MDMDMDHTHMDMCMHMHMHMSLHVILHPHGAQERGSTGGGSDCVRSVLLSGCQRCCQTLGCCCQVLSGGAVGVAVRL